MEITSKFYLSLFTLKQASRRSWRIGQEHNVKVIFIAYKNTPQHKALQLIGAKVAAANSLEGRLVGDDDLSSMGNEDEDVQMALAKSIINNESMDGEIELSSISNFGNDRDWDSFELWYRELLETMKSSKKSFNLDNVKCLDKVLYKGEYHEVCLSNKYEKIIVVQGEGNLLLSDIKEHIDDCKTLSFEEKFDDSNTDIEMKMEYKVCRELLEYHKSGDLYGGVSYGPNNEWLRLSSTIVPFEITDEYRHGKHNGLQIQIVRDENNYANQLIYEEIKYTKDSAFTKVKEMKRVDFSDIKDALVKDDVFYLSSILYDIIGEYSLEPIEKCKNVVIYDEVTDSKAKGSSKVVKKSEQKIIYYEGTGKKMKRIETTLDKCKGGVQASLF